MEDIKEKISILLKEEAENLIHSHDQLSSKLRQLNFIFNIQKVLINYEELEPVLRDFFNRKAQKDKWERNDED